MAENSNKSKKPKAETMYLIWSPEIGFVSPTNAVSRANAIQAFDLHNGAGREFAVYKKEFGYRVIRCRVTPLNKKARTK